MAAAAPLAGCVSTAIGAGATAAVAASEERGIAGAAIDIRIRTDINSRWADASLEIWQDLGLDVVERRVMLTGKVPTAADRARAVRLVWGVDGVTEVIDEIKVSTAGDVGNYARDAWISTQLRTKVLLDKQDHVDQLFDRDGRPGGVSDRHRPGPGRARPGARPMRARFPTSRRW